ncbi:PREDICTED: basic leucine zipper 43 [Tarenaya hassleriana]|uniref:BZIP domain-containing protein n=1 Tax=Tarenaya spinosa TaxID=228870 RepID=Q1KUX8_9ROSI|nr:PREDICTED: basic leucine zipper 43 [Tarenaya hassleriana]XP_019058948.1 PREDICTED: basic leucine zipper 43 [Tarenaya hassleriana]XP_019058949.1 PREDICTED: basic leucine zipper 43 [Tarenaya hassleriana]ABD96858.1 hypothetical protein [Tarenaya spinosa]
MQPSDASELYYLVPSSSSPHSAYLSTISNNNMQEFHLNQYLNPSCNFSFNPQVQELNLQSPCFSNNSTSDEADEQQLSIINERKQRRMISNRESARRSRMRKQRHLDELLSQVAWLRNENHQLINKLNQVSESHDCVLQENAQLKEETSELRQLVTTMKLRSQYSCLEDFPCNMTHPRTEPSN